MNKQINNILAKCIHANTGCLEYTGYVSSDGYCRSKVDNVFQTLHRAVYKHLIGPIPQGMIVRHTCDNRKCLNIAHLALGTHHDNNNDAILRKRHKPGKWKPITDETRTEAINLIKQGISQAKISAILGIAQTTVSIIGIQAGLRRR